MSTLALREEHGALRDALMVIAKGGSLSPAAVLEAARDPNSPLHGEFEWDDGAAAEAFRLVQAGALIRRVKISVVVQERDPVRVRLRAFVSQPSLRGSAPGGSYVPLAAADKDEIRQEALNQLANIARRFRHIVDLESVWAAIDAVKTGGGAA